MVRHHVGPVETLAEAIAARRLLWVLCKACGHAVRLDPRHVATLVGELSLRQLQPRLGCRRCRKRRAAIVLDDEGWAGR